MTRLARGLKCGPCVLFALSANNICGPSTPARPTMPKPPHIRRSMSRRESTEEAAKESVHIKHLVRSQEHLRVLLPAAQFRSRGTVQKFQRQFHLRAIRFAGKEHLIRTLHARAL